MQDLPPSTAVPGNLSLFDCQVWRRVLSQAENDPRMLAEMIQCLNRSTAQCTNQEELDTLIGNTVISQNVVILY